MGNFPHRIRRQRWTLRVDSTATAFTLRQRLREDWPGVLLPVFERVFDQEAGDEEVVRIPRVDLTLKVAPEAKTGTSWTALIQEQLLGQLREIMLARSDGQKKPTEWKRSTSRQDRLQDLLHYLRSGSVSWEAAGISASERAVELQETCRKRWPELATLLRAGPAPSLVFCFRLLQLLPAAEAGAAVRAILGEASFPGQASLLEMLTSLLAPEQEHFSRYTQLQLTAFLLSEALAARLNDTIPDLVRIARRALVLESGVLEAFLASLPAPAGAHASVDSISKKGTATTKDLDAKIPVAIHLARPSPRSRLAVLPEIPGVLQNQDSSAQTVPARERSPFESTAEEDFPLLAAHGGLILLHPFLPRLFESTGIKEKGNVELSFFVLPRAAALLHLLATGQEAIYEYDLVFIKVLLGVNPETPLCVSEGLLAAADTQEAEGLLQSAITLWTALKNTSIAGFRSSFLDRPALLRNEDRGWRLQMERQPFDVLLEYLPWSIGVVKLPWMKRPLYTEW